jgi:hypothetical protein
MACTAAKAAMRAADTGTMCRAAAAAAMTAAAAAAAMTAATAAAAAAAASRCKPDAWAEVSLFVEDVKSRQAYVEDLLLGEKNSRPEVL